MKPKKYFQLTVSQRYQIQALLKVGLPHKEIALKLGISECTLSRELKRNTMHNGVYKAEFAQMLTDYRHKSKRKHTKLTDELKQTIAFYLTEHQWSPEQIAVTFKNEGRYMVSHERIYLYIYEDKREGGYLYQYLRRKHRKRRKRKLCKQSRGLIKNRIPINKRPKIVEKRSRIGDWEVDTIIGKNHKGAIVTITERKSRYSLAKKLKNRKADIVEKAIIELLEPIKEKVKTITADNGKEFANHENIAKNLNAKFFFADPYSAWQRGANENINGLIRQYIPKKSDFENYSNSDIKLIMSKLNNRPKKCLNFNSPYNIFNNKKIALIT